MLHAGLLRIDRPRQLCATLCADAVFGARDGAFVCPGRAGAGTQPYGDASGGSAAAGFCCLRNRAGGAAPRRSSCQAARRSWVWACARYLRAFGGCVGVWRQVARRSRVNGGFSARRGASDGRNRLPYRCVCRPQCRAHDLARRRGHRLGRLAALADGRERSGRRRPI